MLFMFAFGPFDIAIMTAYSQTWTHLYYKPRQNKITQNLKKQQE